MPNKVEAADVTFKALTLNDVNLHSGASTRQPIITSLKKNTIVTVTFQINGWSKVNTDHLSGWIYGDVLKSQTTVKSDSVNVYEKPSTRKQIINTLPSGTEISIISEINGWYQISFGNLNGWVYSTHLVKESKPINSLTLSAIALTDGIKVYSGASTRTKVVSSLKKNEKVQITNQINGWNQITSSTTNGWVYEGLLAANVSVKAIKTNVYEKPSTRSSSIGSFTQGDKLLIDSEINGWYFVTSSKLNGWVYNTHLLKESVPLQTTPTLSAISLTSGLKVHSGASTRTSTISSLKKDQRVTITRQINGWNQITSPSISGWVFGGLLTSDLTVKASQVNVYENASTRSKIIASFKSGNKISVNKEINGWYYVTSPTINGWVYSNHINLGSPKPLENTTTIPSIVTLNGLKVYSGASTRTTVIGSLGKDQNVIVNYQINGWNRFTSETINGWVYGGVLKKETPVSSTYVAVYEKPSTRSAVITNLTSGDTIQVEKEINGWYFFTSAKGSGWLFGAHLKTGSPLPDPLSGKVIVIDPGHGGSDSGAIGRTYKTYEKNLALSTSKLISTKLTKAGAKVIMTRSTDVFIELGNRAQVSNKNYADAFISIHYNSFPVSTSSPNGLESYYYNYNKDYFLAKSIHDSMTGNTIGLMKNRGVKYGNLSVLRNNYRPAALLELGFLSDPLDERLVLKDSYQETVSNAIVQGLRNYFK
ncbi:SH3 domain-containing protein [Fictibacillus sp. 7GRE50]|uniref:SH3 domain-containing protein n=1 Tax=Fictibacillus sp. 7GRE50 TaxID=2745878 RepID=UPI0018CDC9B2|nr:SH3 domain-containing protein [Fictibacillus sp. 7GRE50]MBH0164076.1 SH3 domain-containing protein [Fictibacillus sp. 7GRE50]